MTRNTAGQSVGAQMINAITGGAFVGTVTVYVTGDAGTQAIGSVGSGLATSEGNGFYTYLPSQAETNYAVVAFTFVGTGAVPATIQIATLTAAQAVALQAAAAPGAISVLDLLTSAAAELNIFDAGTALEASQAAFILQIANDYLDSLATEGLSVSTITRATWTITGASSYAIGIGATINAPRPPSPADILSLGYIDAAASSVEVQTGAPMSDADYAAIGFKSDTGPYPVQWYYQATVPTGTLIPWPIPPAGSLTGVIYVPALLSEFTSLAQTIVLPPGSRRMLRLNLAIEIAGAYEKQPPPGLIERARRATSLYKTKNVRMVDLQTGPSGRYDIFSDTNVS
jgi:hypothetical protein